ncbi:MAG: hypothetical protein ACHP84_13045 [Caulobacterales bacterium]
MRLKTLAALPLAALLLAQSPPPAPAPAPRLFISPSGEPFRLSPTVPDPVAAWFERANAAHDGKLTKAEFRADAEAFFQRLDTNHDGVIDGFELAAYEKNVVPELSAAVYDRAPGEGDGEHTRRHEGSQTKGGASHGPKTAAIAMLLDEPEPVADADLELDGHITLAEWRKAADERFGVLDKADAGYLTLAGLKALMSQPPKARR